MKAPFIFRKQKKRNPKNPNPRRIKTKKERGDEETRRTGKAEIGRNVESKM